MVRRVLPAVALGVFLAATLAIAINAVSWSTAQALTNCSTSTQAIDGSEQQLFSLINTFRQQNGRAALKPSPNLSRAAAWMSEDVTASGKFSHTDSLERSPFSRVQQCGYASSGAGENMALTGSAQSAFSLFEGSTAGHRENMLNASWTVMGVGHTGSIWVVDFGSFDDSNQSWDGGPPATATATPTVPSVPKTVVPTPTTASAHSPSNSPIRRASLPMLSAE